MEITLEMFTVKCDNCRKEFEDDHMGYSAWSTFADAWEYASESGWVWENGSHYCSDCYFYDDNDNLVLNEKRVNIYK